MRFLWRKKNNVTRSAGASRNEDSKQSNDQMTLEQITKSRQELLELIKVLNSF
jgi:hypothetical protein